MNFDKIMNYRQNKTFAEFARFFIVGVLATGIDATLFYVGYISSGFNYWLSCKFNRKLLSHDKVDF